DGGGTEPVYEPASGTLVVGSEVGSADGFTYTIESRIPQHDPALIAAAGDEIPGQIADRYLDLPPDFDDDDHPVVRAASEATAGATTPYERALALQDWFRANFTYDL